MLNKLKLGILSTSTLLLLAACGGNDTTTEEPASTDDSAVETPTESTDDATDDTTNDTAGDDTSDGISNVAFPITMDDAVQIFRDTYGEDVKINEIDFDDYNIVYTYEISGWDDTSEYDLEIDAETGEIIDR